MEKKSQSRDTKRNGERKERKRERERERERERAETKSVFFPSVLSHERPSAHALSNPKKVLFSLSLVNSHLSPSPTQKKPLLITRKHATVRKERNGLCHRK